MRLLKIIVVLFIIYFIRRFIQMYKTLKQINDNNELLMKQKSSHAYPEKKSQAIDADFKVID